MAKALVDRWFYNNGIPFRIHSDWGKSFDNQIIHHLCTVYGVKQSSTTQYNPCGSSKCERFNQTLHDLLKMLPKSQKPNWPAHLNSLVLAYNATPNSTIELQQYQLIFGCKALTLCDNCFGPEQLWFQWVSIHILLGTETSQADAGCKSACIENIQKSAEQSAHRTGEKELSIPEGNLVLLWDHPKDQNKIQDWFID